MSLRPQTLYKVHGLPDCDTLQIIARYLYAKGINTRPITIIERSFPSNILETDLPIIVYPNNLKLIGLTNIVNYYEIQFNITNLIDKAQKFNENNPDYKMTDRSTHKNLIF